MNRGDAPTDYLEPHGSYAFKRRRGGGKRPSVLIDDKRRAVPLAQLRRFKVSEFEGRSLEGQRQPEGALWAWSIGNPTMVFEERRQSDRAYFEIARHRPLVIEDQDPVQSRGHSWIEVTDPTRPDLTGWALSSEIRRWLPAPPPPGVEPGQIWIDVELSQQMLAVHRGSELVHLTLISSGRRADPTPRGLFRIRNKQAYGKMRSLDDAEEPYYVEGVPWAQYFHRRYALHAAYWHNRFGRPASHGCVNVSPKDARRIFELTSPTVPGGWISANEHSDDLGTLVRVRRHGDSNVPDMRNSE
jgi:hypothetical protein